MPHKILVYADDKAAIGSIITSLQDSFNRKEFRIEKIKAADIRNGALRDPKAQIFILPGIVGDVSPYSSQLGQTELAEIHGFLKSKPNVMLTICAGSYFVSRETVYTPPWSAPRGRKSLAPLFNGAARGPVADYARASTPESRFDDVVVVPVNFKKADGSWEKTKICYGNGPALYPDDEKDPAVEVLATFADSPGQPAALLRQSTGQGALYMSCVLPEISYQHIAPARGLKSARQLMKDLKPYEAGRNCLWNTLITRMKQDLKL